MIRVTTEKSPRGVEKIHGAKGSFFGARDQEILSSNMIGTRERTCSVSGKSSERHACTRESRPVHLPGGGSLFLFFLALGRGVDMLFVSTPPSLVSPVVQGSLVLAEDAGFRPAA